MTNYFDKNGNYINCENLSLTEIYKRGFLDGYTKAARGSGKAGCINAVENDMAGLADRLFDRLMNGGIT